MFNKVSKAGVGGYTLFLTVLLQLLGFEVPEETTKELVLVGVEAVSLFLVLYGNWDRDDLFGGILRK